MGNTSEVEGSIEERVNTLTNQVSVLTDLLTKLVTQGGGGAQVLGDSAPEVEARLGGSPREEGLPKSQYGIRATPPPPSLREEELARQIHAGGARSDVGGTRSGMGGARSDVGGDGSDESDADLVSRSSTSSMRVVRARAMGVKPDSLKVSKFDGTHYNLWAKSMRYYLSVAGLLDVVIGESPRPIVDEEGLVWLGPDRKVLGDEGDVREWDSLNTSACSVLFNSLTRDQQHFVEDCEEAHQIWIILRDIYMRSTVINKSHVIEEYEAYHMKKGVSMQTYISGLKSLLSRLKGLSVDIPEELKVIKLLKGLREDYEMDRKILKNKEGLSFEEACGSLLSEALMQGGSGARKGENALANAASSQTSSSKRGGYKKDGTRLPKTCFICGGEGHFALQCPRKKEGGERSYLCYVCGSDKHKAYACPKRAAAGGQPPPKGGATDGGAKGQASS